MWRRSYFALVLLRLYFALCSSYLHPDENFQGPEVIAGRIFGYPVHQTWEFTSENPIRSAFTLWPIYGVPMMLLKWLWEGSGRGLVRPAVVFWTLRSIMFLLSFILQDWAVHELIDSRRQRRAALLLVASCYVTCVWQVHTFSNSVETLAVLWSLVLIKRIREHKDSRFSISAPGVLGFLLVFGTFNRITFPTFLVIPCLQLIPALLQRPSHLIILMLSAALTTLLAVYVDTVFYTDPTISLLDTLGAPVLAPLNALKYNSQASNLALHGTHPFYQHVLINLPQLLGPALVLLLIQPHFGLALTSAISGTVLMSVVSHQEARFLLPAVPLFLASVTLPTKHTRAWLSAWIIFNLCLAILMGVYHQAGVVPAQTWLEEQRIIESADIFWWKTYSPPTWLLNGRIGDLRTIDLMGFPASELPERICQAGNQNDANRKKLLVAPTSATFLDQFVFQDEPAQDIMRLNEIWRTKTHLNLDDMDFGDDGILPTLSRVVGRRGLAVWQVDCPLRNRASFGIGRDW